MELRIKKFETVYDSCHTSPHIIFIVPSIIMLIGLVLIIYHWKNKKTPGRLKNLIVGWVMFGVTVLINITLITTYANVHKTLLNIYNKKMYQITEGEIENFIPMPYEGHAHESFTLNGLYFEYSDSYIGHIGFNNAASHGGPIRENGQYVRLTYVTDYYYGQDSVFKSNYIIKIELDRNQKK